MRSVGERMSETGLPQVEEEPETQEVAEVKQNLSSSSTQPLTQPAQELSMDEVTTSWLPT